MTGALIRTGWLSLKRDYVALGLTFVLPIVFFSIFAAIFGGMTDSVSATDAVEVVLVDEDRSELSRRVAKALRGEPALEVWPGSPTAEDARALVRRGEAPAAIVLPRGFGGGLAAEILYDEADPVARQVAAGMLVKSTMTEAARELMPEGTADPGGAFGSPVKIEMTNVRAAEEEGGGETGSMVAYYAAGIGVMFLLFSMAGAAGTLLEEEENGTLERLLASRVSMGTLLAGRWLFFALVGLCQVTVMFVWGALVFGLDLFTPSHLAGFLAVASFTAAAAAAFGVCLATICRTRAQLGGISTVVILIMSALGGSMVPRFVMPEFMNTTALFTFNGWALDGWLKVFWYDEPGAGVLRSLAALAPQLAALLLMTGGFLVAARLLARRWESV